MDPLGWLPFDLSLDSCHCNFSPVGTAPRSTPHPSPVPFPSPHAHPFFRSDLEKAISAHGGPSQVAAQLGWKQRAKGRRPKGYWDSLDNVRAELDEFIEEAGLPRGVRAGWAWQGIVRWGRW